MLKLGRRRRRQCRSISRTIGADPIRVLKAPMRRSARPAARSEDDRDGAKTATRLLTFRSTPRHCEHVCGGAKGAAPWMPTHGHHHEQSLLGRDLATSRRSGKHRQSCSSVGRCGRYHARNSDGARCQATRVRVEHDAQASLVNRISKD
jgi:hypothetical protein